MGRTTRTTARGRTTRGATTRGGTTRRSAERRTRRGPGLTRLRAAAGNRLRRFRKASLLALSITGVLLVLFGAPEVAAPQSSDAAPGLAGDTTVADTPGTADGGAVVDSGARANAEESVGEATGAVRAFAYDFTALLPKLAVAAVLLLAAGLLVRLIRGLLRRVSRRWEKADAATSIIAVLVWLVAAGAALTVISGDTRALLGSVGLLGLALSWALQAPIESFAGWLLNSFKGYYRVGDRIAVGEVFGDVYRVDSLTTTVWEAGGPDKPVQGAQPTGALITFPNSEVLRANIINYTRLFPYVWDEITIGVANESDLAYAVGVVRAVATEVVGPAMTDPVARYRSLLRRERLDYDIEDVPQVYLSLAESWTDITVRYLVAARQRRHWSSELILAIETEIAKPLHRGRIVSAYPVRRLADAPPARSTSPDAST